MQQPKPGNIRFRLVGAPLRAFAIRPDTPPTQALEFHRALVENDVPSELVVYPLEGHGVRQLEAQADQMTRMLDWLERFMPERGAAS